MDRRSFLRRSIDHPDHRLRDQETCYSQLTIIIEVAVLLAQLGKSPRQGTANKTGNHSSNSTFSPSDKSIQKAVFCRARSSTTSSLCKPSQDPNAPRPRMKTADEDGGSEVQTPATSVITLLVNQELPPSLRRPNKINGYCLLLPAERLMAIMFRRRLSKEEPRMCAYGIRLYNDVYLERREGTRGSNAFGSAATF